MALFGPLEVHDTILERVVRHCENGSDQLLVTSRAAGESRRERQQQTRAMLAGTQMIADELDEVRDILSEQDAILRDPFCKQVEVRSPRESEFGGGDRIDPRPAE